MRKVWPKKQNSKGTKGKWRIAEGFQSFVIILIKNGKHISYSQVIHVKNNDFGEEEWLIWKLCIPSENFYYFSDYHLLWNVMLLPVAFCFKLSSFICMITGICMYHSEQKRSNRKRAAYCSWQSWNKTKFCSLWAEQTNMSSWVLSTCKATRCQL